MKIIVIGVMIWANSQWSGIAILNPYRSWWVEYSYGKTYNEKREWINLWHFPKLGHTDIRKFLSNPKLSAEGEK